MQSAFAVADTPPISRFAMARTKLRVFRTIKRLANFHRRRFRSQPHWLQPERTLGHGFDRWASVARGTILTLVLIEFVGFLLFTIYLVKTMNAQSSAAVNTPAR
jgi:hypothetical protein